MKSGVLWPELAILFVEVCVPHACNEALAAGRGYVCMYPVSVVGYPSELFTLGHKIPKTTTKHCVALEYLARFAFGGGGGAGNLLCVGPCVGHAIEEHVEVYSSYKTASSVCCHIEVCRPPHTIDLSS